MQTYDQALAASSRERRAADEAWPAIAATERLAYRALARCWAMEHPDAATQEPNALDAAMAERVHAAIGELIAGVRGGAKPIAPRAPTLVMDEELRALRDCLARGAVTG